MSWTRPVVGRRRGPSSVQSEDGKETAVGFQGWFGW